MCKTTEKQLEKSPWQEWFCFENQCEFLHHGETSCNAYNNACDFFLLHQKKQMIMPSKTESSAIKSKISKKIAEIRLNIAKSIADYKGKMIVISTPIENADNS